MKLSNTYRFITFILIGLLTVAFSQSFSKVEKVEKAKKEQTQQQDEQEHEHILKTYEAVITVDQQIASDDSDYLPLLDFPTAQVLEGIATEQIALAVLSYFEVLFETSICTNAP